MIKFILYSIELQNFNLRIIITPWIYHIWNGYSLNKTQPIQQFYNQNELILICFVNDQCFNINKERIFI